MVSKEAYFKEAILYSMFIRIYMRYFVGVGCWFIVVPKIYTELEQHDLSLVYSCGVLYMYSGSIIIVPTTLEMKRKMMLL